MIATWSGVTVARSDDTIVVEGNHYFPESDVRMELLKPVARRSLCIWRAWPTTGTSRSRVLARRVRPGGTAVRRRWPGG